MSDPCVGSKLACPLGVCEDSWVGDASLVKIVSFRAQGEPSILPYPPVSTLSILRPGRLPPPVSIENQYKYILVHFYKFVSQFFLHKIRDGRIEIVVFSKYHESNSFVYIFFEGSILFNLFVLTFLSA